MKTIPYLSFDGDCAEAFRFYAEVLMGGDRPPGWENGTQGFSISLRVDSAEDAERIFGRLAEGGEVTMPLEPSFWAERFGMLVDRYGTPWMVNYEGSVRYELQTPTPSGA